MNRIQADRAHETLRTVNDAMNNVRFRAINYNDVRFEDLRYLRDAWSNFDRAIRPHLVKSGVFPHKARKS